MKNALEAYVYEMRGKLETCLQQHTTETERDSFNKVLTDTEDWIYGDGAEAKKSVLSKRLEALQKTGGRYYLRFTEAGRRPPAISALASSCEVSSWSCLLNAIISKRFRVNCYLYLESSKCGGRLLSKGSTV